jgi:serine/threonine-protein kinase RsbW
MGEDLESQSRTVDQVLDSTLESVDTAERAALDLAREAGFGEEELDRIGMSVRECMVNAVVHGNRYSSHKKVQFSVSRTPQRLTIRIADQGDGFDPDEIPDPLSGDNLLRHSGRGMFLMKSFMDDLQVRRLSPVGTEVTLVKNVLQKSDRKQGEMLP